MARIRTIKPRFFRHEGLFEAEQQSGLPLRLAFAGLFTVVDREGRFRWEPRTLKLDCLPYDQVDFAKVMDALAHYGFVTKYQVNGEWFGCIESWKKHQVINQREPKSELPELTDEMRAHVRTCTHMPEPVPVYGEGKGREEEGKGKGTDAPSAQLVDLNPAEAERQLFERGKQILKSSSGGLIKNLLKAKGGSIALARSALEMASTKSDPREYIGAIIRGRDQQDDDRARGRAW